LSPANEPARIGITPLKSIVDASPSEKIWSHESFGSMVAHKEIRTGFLSAWVVLTGIPDRFSHASVLEMENHKSCNRGNRSEGECGSTVRKSHPGTAAALHRQRRARERKEKAGHFVLFEKNSECGEPI
jgi:hypothetical protein